MLKLWAAWSPRTRWLVGIAAALVLGPVLVWALLVPLADGLAHHDVGSATGPMHETALDNARGRLLTLAAGLVAVVALVFTARTFHMSREGQVTDRYTKAIEQLGSDKLDVRIGGIYALERIARDSKRDHPAVMDVLTAFIREHSWEPWPLPRTEEEEDADLVEFTRPDIQAALTVVGRRAAGHDIGSIDLTRADLTRAAITGAHLDGANLTSAASQLAPIGELMTLSVAPSAAAIILNRERIADRVHDATEGRLLVVADPERQDTSPLPGARDEAHQIEAAFPARTDVLTGPEARTDTVLNQLPTCWIAHLACHGTNDPLQPQAMRLLLGDGDVTLDQLLQLPELHARLVVLSACQSGQVDIARVSDEMLGMPLAFLQAGACTVVSTLWPIDDHVTAMLIGRFYEELSAHIGTDGPGDVAAALARAQRWLRSLTTEQARRWRQQRHVRELPISRPDTSTVPLRLSATSTPYADPYFWAGLVAYGR